jgi:hypothetical protein
MNSDDRAREGRNQRHFSRRKFMAGAAAVSAGAVVGGQLPTVAHAAEGGSGLHGVELRGMYLTSKNRLAEGRFGLMFKQLPAFAPSDDLLGELANTMVEDQTVPDANHMNTSPVLFAGFTFIGQFIDHDITFDTTPLDEQLADPNATVNFRTARYDLDSVYGPGPVNDAPIYDPEDPAKLLLRPNINTVLDVPRDGAGRAIIPDPRNDENLIIVQFHKAVIQFHNKLVDYARSKGIRREWVFETARRLARWHYQWAVIHDFLPRFVGKELVGPTGTVYKEVAGKPPVLNVRYYKPTNKADRPFMPVEFAVAAYRFAHSIIRPAYIINQTSEDRGGVPIFGPDGGFNLNGGRPIPGPPDDLAIVWNNILPELGPPGGRPPRKIDTQLSPPLTTLPTSAVPEGDATKHLAVRNTLRGKRVGLPSGQQVAKAMRITALSNTQLELDSRWGGQAPLWYYILKEAEVLHDGKQLGPVGGRIMAETLVGLLQRDPNSYLYLDPAWKPSLPAANAGDFTFADLLKFAGAA